MEQFIKGKRILITGGTGTLGQALVKEILRYNPEVVRIYSRDEEKQFWLQQELQTYPNVRFLLGDVRDKERLSRALAGIQIVFHTAALKQVPACEYNPFEAVKTNVLGTQNVIEAALAENVAHLIYASSDKAINPTSTMGATKLLAERLVANAAYWKGKAKTTFSAVRFGNVLGSRGSVLLLFARQIAAGGPVTVTDPEMTRFMMRTEEAVSLTLKAGMLARGGEIFVLKMPVVRLGDLVEVMKEELASLYGRKPEEIPVQVTGLRPGEKYYEELMTVNEAEGAWENAKMFIIPSPFGRWANYPGFVPAGPRSYSSHAHPPLSKEEVRALVLKEELLWKQMQVRKGERERESEGACNRRGRLYRAVGG